MAKSEFSSVATGAGLAAGEIAKTASPLKRAAQDINGQTVRIRQLTDRLEETLQDAFGIVPPPRGQEADPQPEVQDQSQAANLRVAALTLDDEVDRLDLLIRKTIETLS